ncbi:radical S-adenosyl methionine domain-containing protein 1, mitochondrial [Microcaecilia unicolor]|uniref:Radical S-adenosyl methionine domain-containing protein n=1 Tax=Microcaecilia unicolor TaxID=1415580 RepID=A0A6P7YH35_9AMPH|nr:radical S-adenosyl methionine domain-containing protein 1, mitochondrial [Microcaecilia unicolor]
MMPGQLCQVYPRFSLLSNILRRSVMVQKLVLSQWPSWKNPRSRECSTWSDQAALYVHWPYCQKRCSYCNFNKYIARNVDEEVMKQCLVREAGTLIQLSQVSRISSVFFGGGTPSLMSPSTIAAILESVSKHAHLAGDAEVTVEVNPTSAEASRLAGFRLAGVNRLSIGIQSLDDGDLRLLGRNHTALDSLRTLKEARRLFPGATSVDVIFGLPGQTVTSWVGTLKELLGLCDDHVSLYQLTLERGTALFAQVQKGLLSRPEPEVLAEMYDVARQILCSEGFRQYEVSNFARNGALSIHNQSYWQGRQYIGVGPGAHGRFVPRKDGKNLREARIQTLEPDPWMREVMSVGHGTRKRTDQSELDVLEEVLVMGLRMDVGITHEHWRQFMPSLTLQTVFGTSQQVRALEEQGFLLLDDSGLRCSWKGLAVLDSLLLTLLNQLQQSW